MVIEDKKYGIDEVFGMIGQRHLKGNNDGRKFKSDIVVDGFNVHTKSLRYMTFYQKGVKCVCCGKEGTHFKLCGEEGSNRRHFNLYADDGTLITKDHIVPASKGGPDKVTNMQPMCEDCNLAKSNDSDAKVEYIVARHTGKGTEQAFRSIETAVMWAANQYAGCKSKKIKKEEAMKAVARVCRNILTAIEIGTPAYNYTWTKEMR